MLGAYFNLRCSAQCARLLAFGYLQDESKVSSLASRLKNDNSLTTMKLAAELAKLPAETGQKIARDTLEQAGYNSAGRAAAFDVRKLIKWNTPKVQP